MTTTPDGLPVWTHTAEHTIYGGATDKANYQSQGAINPRTDITAEQFCRLAEDVAECARTAAFAVMSISCNDTPAAAPTVNWCRMNTAVQSSSYSGDAPPTGFPSVARNTDGAVDITFAATYTDAYGVSAAFTLQHAIPSAVTSTIATLNWTISGNVLTIRSYDSSSAAVQDAQYTVEVA